MTGRSSCPECGTILRIRDRSFVGRRVNCPECKTSLRIESADGKGHYVAARAKPEGHDDNLSRPEKAKLSVETKVVSESTWQSLIRRWIYSPLTVAWLLAIAASVFIGVLTLSPKFRFAHVRQTSVRIPAEETIETPPVVEHETPGMDDHSDAEKPAKPPASAEVSIVELSALEPSNATGPPPAAPTPTMQDEPPKPKVEPPAPPPMKADIPITAKMAQPITRYTQRKIRRRDLLEALQEQLDAPIHYDEQNLGSESLDETVAFDLADTTIGDVIRAVANLAHWEITIEETGLRLERQRGPANP